ncbi:kinase-like domain-containing protein [Lentinula raphanica]|nr:kinase-like domain-containing protein [Lentinula raphanica]
MDVLGITKDAIGLITLLYEKYSEYQDADETIKSICTRLDGVRVRLELYEEYLFRAESNLRSRHKQVLVKSLERVTDILHDLSERLPDPITVAKKFAWVAWGKRRVEGLLSDLDVWDNDSQRTIFTYDMLNRIRGHDLHYERLFNTGDRSLAATWSLSRRIHSSNEVRLVSNIAIPPETTITIAESDYRYRYMARLGSELVYIETLPHRRHDNGGERRQVIERQNRIAEVFHSSDLPSMHLLSCLGTVRHHLVYEIPKPDVEMGGLHWNGSVPTLAGVLGNEIRMSLEDRFRIASEITVAVMTIHAAGWVHKDIRSDNVLFFYEENRQGYITRTTQIGSAYLVGFGGARPQTSTSARYTENDLVKRRYQHPERKGTSVEKFDIRHDMYSLGVVLIELGLQRLLSELNDQDGEDIGARKDQKGIEEDHTYLVNKSAHELRDIMGSKYVNAVLTCLTKSTQKEKTTDVLREEFYDDVLLPLKEIFEGLKMRCSSK